MIAVVLFVAVVTVVAGLPLAHWTQKPPYLPWRRP